MLLIINSISSNRYVSLYSPGIIACIVVLIVQLPPGTLNLMYCPHIVHYVTRINIINITVQVHLILYGEELTPDKIVGNGMYRDVPGMYFDCHTCVEQGRSYESILTLNRFVTTPKFYSLQLVGGGGGDSKNKNEKPKLYNSRCLSTASRSHYCVKSRFKDSTEKITKKTLVVSCMNV